MGDGKTTGWFYDRDPHDQAGYTARDRASELLRAEPDPPAAAEKMDPGRRRHDCDLLPADVLYYLPFPVVHEAAGAARGPGTVRLRQGSFARKALSGLFCFHTSAGRPAQSASQSRRIRFRRRWSIRC